MAENPSLQAKCSGMCSWPSMGRRRTGSRRPSGSGQTVSPRSSTINAHQGGNLGAPSPDPTLLIICTPPFLFGCTGYSSFDNCSGTVAHACAGRRQGCRVRTFRKRLGRARASRCNAAVRGNCPLAPCEDLPTPQMMAPMPTVLLRSTTLRT